MSEELLRTTLEFGVNISRLSYLQGKLEGVLMVVHAISKCNDIPSMTRELEKLKPEIAKIQKELEKARRGGEKPLLMVVRAIKNSKKQKRKV